MRFIFMFVGSVVAWGFPSLYAQSPDFSTSARVLYQFTQVVCKDGNAKMGVFVGLQADSVLLHASGKTERISRQDMLTLSMEKKHERATPALSGMLLGIYAGNLLFVKAEGQPFSYTRSYNGSFEPILYNTLFAFVGGGVGYLVGATESGTASFDFSGSEDANEKEWERLRSFISGKDDKSAVHLSMQGSWVTSSLPNSVNSFYSSFPHEPASNLNMMRKIQVALTLSPLVDAGLAIMWVGQPSSSSFGTSYHSSYGTIELDGTGYYAVGVIKPLHSLGLRNVQWDIGVGAGLASMNYKQTQADSYWLPDSLRSPNVEMKKKLFSGMVYTELKVFLSDHFSLGVVGDYVYISDETPAIPKIHLESKRMGTTSFGFALGIHF